MFILCLLLNLAWQSPSQAVVLETFVEDRRRPTELERLDVQVQLDGFLAETTLVLVFHNQDQRDLEGELVFSLPDGAVITGYGLDVDGRLVDGVVVEAARARFVFEREAWPRWIPVWWSRWPGMSSAPRSIRFLPVGGERSNCAICRPWTSAI